MKEEQINARGLSLKELQEIIDAAVLRKNRPTKQVLEDLEKALMLLVELVPGFAKRALKAIQKKHPSLFEDMTS